MDTNIVELPEDLDSLKDIIFDLQNTYIQLEDKVERLAKEKLELEGKIEYLRFQLMRSLKKQYGKTSERMETGQLELPFFDEAIVENAEEIEIAEEEIAVAGYTRLKQGRKALQAWLTRKQIIYDLPEEEKVCGCGHPLHKIGEDKSEQLEYVPATAKVIENIKYKYACRACEEGIKTAEAPKQIIPKGIATPGLLAHVMVSKFEDHLPLYRQERIMQRIGIDIPRSTFCNWVLKCGEAVLPLIMLSKEELVLGNYCHADETTIQVLQQEGKAATSKSYMWVYANGPPAKPIIIYDYQPSRSGGSAAEFLKDFTGYLQTDGYSGYNILRERKDIINLDCWAHARRKFFEIVKVTKNSGKAQTVLNLIQKLYKVEKQAEEFSAEQTYQLRQEKSVPILERLKIFLEEIVDRVPPKSPLGLAIAYTLNRWTSLNVYLASGYLRIDNNYVENKIRPFALGRRNWLFMGNVRGAIAAANLLSLIESAKANGLEPYYYLRYIFTQIPLCKDNEELKRLLPHHCDTSEVIKI